MVNFLKEFVSSWGFLLGKNTHKRSRLEENLQGNVANKGVFTYRSYQEGKFRREKNPNAHWKCFKKVFFFQVLCTWVLNDNEILRSGNWLTTIVEMVTPVVEKKKKKKEKKKEKIGSIHWRLIRCFLRIASLHFYANEIGIPLYR